VTAIVPDQSSTSDSAENDASSQDGKDDDSDPVKYPKSGKQSTTDKVLPDESAGRTIDTSLKSHGAPLNYSKVSPVGYEHGEPIGSYDRIVFVTPKDVIPSFEPDLRHEADSSLPSNGPPSTGPSVDNFHAFVSTSFRETGSPIAASDEAEPIRIMTSGGAREVSSTGSGPQDVPSLTVPVDSSDSQLPLITSLLVKPEEWATVTATFLRVLDSWVPDTDDPESLWKHIYSWGSAAATIALATELTRRFRHTVRTSEWDDWHGRPRV
jgi:hypothetical protein